MQTNSPPPTLLHPCEAFANLYQRPTGFSRRAGVAHRLDGATSSDWSSEFTSKQSLSGGSLACKRLGKVSAAVFYQVFTAKLSSPEHYQTSYSSSFPPELGQTDQPEVIFYYVCMCTDFWPEAIFFFQMSLPALVKCKLKTCSYKVNVEKINKINISYY